MTESRGHHTEKLLHHAHVFDRLAQRLEVADEVGDPHTEVVDRLALLEGDVLEFLQQLLGVHLLHPIGTDSHCPHRLPRLLDGLLPAERLPDLLGNRTQECAHGLTILRPFGVGTWVDHPPDLQRLVVALHQHLPLGVVVTRQHGPHQGTFLDAAGGASLVAHGDRWWRFLENDELLVRWLSRWAYAAVVLHKPRSGTRMLGPQLRRGARRGGTPASGDRVN